MTVFKIGGSLLDLPSLPEIVRRILAGRPGAAAVLIAGGGAAADLIRTWDQTHRLGDETAHELALEAMDLTASLLARFFPEARLVRSEQQIRMAAAEGAMCLVCAGCFVKAAEWQGRSPLERSWRTTSDSIAAWTAEVLGAELVLVKSVPLPAGIGFDEAARIGLVDECFPEIASRLRAVSWVNARAQGAQIIEWFGEPEK
ncbi:MAG TPA: uridylate kinase [Thermoanaerobaculia bacterium]|nr:uridylate kinase [Thermoanaerobaculia bacterium]